MMPLINSTIIPVVRPTLWELFLARVRYCVNLGFRIRRRTWREVVLFSLRRLPLARALFKKISDEFRMLLSHCGQEGLFPDRLVWESSIIEAIREFNIQFKLGPKSFLKAIRDARYGSNYQSQSLSIEKPKKLKILFVTGMFPSVEHAGGLRLFDVISNLSTRHEIDLYSSYSSSLDRPSLDLLSSKMGRIYLVRDDLMSAENATRWLKSNGIVEGYYDVIHFEYNSTVKLIDGLRGWGKKTVFVMTECISKREYMHLIDKSRENSDPKVVGNYLNRFLQNVSEEGRGLQSVDRAVALTENDAQFAKNLFGVLPALVPTGISDFAVYQRVVKVKDFSPEPNSLMFLGYFDHYPNVEGVQWYLRNVHPIVKAQIPKVKFYIVGAGKTEVLTKEFASDPSVLITGRVDDFIPYIARAKVCLSPLIYGAGFRGKINQYAAVGRPTVSTSIGVMGVPYHHRESVWVGDDPQDFAEGIVELLRKPELWKTIASQAERVAWENYSWPKLIEKLEAVYAS